MMKVSSRVIRMHANSAKYINQDGEYFQVLLENADVENRFKSSITNYFDMDGEYRYEYVINAIYEELFKGNTHVYREALKLSEKEKPEDSMYSEVLSTIYSFIEDVSHEMKIKSQNLGRKITCFELNGIIGNVGHRPGYKSQVIRSRRIMASRDFALRDSLHKKLEGYIQPLSRQRV